MRNTKVTPKKTSESQRRTRKGTVRLDLSAEPKDVQEFWFDRLHSPKTKGEGTRAKV